MLVKSRRSNCSRRKLVDGDDGKVSRADLPGVGPDGTREPADEVLLELAPMSMRGEKVGLGLWEVGVGSPVQFEFVIIGAGLRIIDLKNKPVIVFLRRFFDDRNPPPAAQLPNGRRQIYARR